MRVFEYFKKITKRYPIRTLRQETSNMLNTLCENGFFANEVDDDGYIWISTGHRNGFFLLFNLLLGFTSHKYDGH